jgi:chemotaxis protein MotB
MKLVLLVVLSLVFAGCVSQERFDLETKAANEARADALACHTAEQRDRADLAKLGADYSAAKDLVSTREKSLAEATASGRDIQTKLDEATAQNAELRKALEKMGKDADKLLGEKGTLSSALADARARLEELRKAQSAADARAATFRQLAMKLHKMIDSGELSIALRDGRMVIRLPNDVLFDSGQTELKPAGQAALKSLASVLKTLSDRRFQVAGHTDNVPIQTARFPSNWELSNGRAVQVVHFLVSQGMRPETLAAAGYGEFDPVAPNDTTASRAKNRRIEITLQPNIDELVAVPDVK